MRIKLAPAVGNLKLQQALSYTYVKDIVNFLLTREDLLPDIAEILQTCVQKNPPDLAVKLYVTHPLIKDRRVISWQHFHTKHA